MNVEGTAIPCDTGISLTDVYPKLRVPMPGEGEWLDFFIVKKEARHCLYWRLNDGDRDDADTVEFGFISGHRFATPAENKKRWLEQAQRQAGIPA